MNKLRSLPCYLYAVATLILGAAGLAGVWTPSTANSPFAQKLFLGLLPWAVITILGASILLYGMARSKVRWIKTGSLATFCTITFATISFTQTGAGLTAVVVTVPWLIFYAWAYIVSDRVNK